GHFRRPGGGAALLQETGQPAHRAGGGPPGGDAAAPALFSAPPAIALPAPAGTGDCPAHGGNGHSMKYQKQERFSLSFSCFQMVLFLKLFIHKRNKLTL